MIPYTFRQIGDRSQRLWRADGGSCWTKQTRIPHWYGMSI